MIKYAYFIYLLTINIKFSKRDFYRFLVQLELAAVKSLGLVLIIGFFAGALIAWQAAYQFQEIASMSLLGGMVTRVVLMEMGPVLTALILAGRLGAAMTAEIATMKSSEQLDALTSLNISSYNFIGQPRIFAVTLAMPFLCVYSSFIGVIGAFFVAKMFIGITWEVFIDSIHSFFQVQDLVYGILKSFVFGFFISTIACWLGFEAEPSSKGVGESTIKSFVRAAMAVLISDFMIWLILF